MKILIVDDKASIRSTMKQMLNHLGFENITQAIDGEEAWYKIKEAFETLPGDRFDLVISDMEMPKMSGLELLGVIRQNTETRDMPFIMATTVTDRNIILKTMQLGVQAYIIKPFDQPTVEFKLKQAGIL